MNELLLELKKSIHNVLIECDSLETPVICSMKSTSKGENDLVELIIKKIIQQNLTITQSIREIEMEFSNKFTQS